MIEGAGLSDELAGRIAVQGSVLPASQSGHARALHTIQRSFNPAPVARFDLITLIFICTRFLRSKHTRGFAFCLAQSAGRFVNIDRLHVEILHVRRPVRFTGVEDHIGARHARANGRRFAA